MSVNKLNKLVESQYTIAIREISSPLRGKNGLFIEPDDASAKREVIEVHHRDSFANHFKFADMYQGLTRTYDEDGRYNCGRCNQANGTKCLLVAIKRIDREAGSCGDWENQCAGDPEMKLQEKTIPSAGYAIAANGIGFGCNRCPYASPAIVPDSRGRELYCGKGDFRTYGTACCNLNGAKETGGGPDGDYMQLALPDKDSDDD
jgi:hypothetical protein